MKTNIVENKEIKTDIEPNNAQLLSKMIANMATRARLSNKYLSISDARYVTIGIPDIITEQYLYFGDETYEVGTTGKLGGKPQEYEKITPGGKIVLLNAVISIEVSCKP